MCQDQKIRKMPEKPLYDIPKSQCHGLIMIVAFAAIISQVRRAKLRKVERTLLAASVLMKVHYST